MQPLIGWVAAYNVTFLLSFALSGYTTYLLVCYLTHSRTAAFVAGLVFAFSPYHLSHFNHPNLISIQWLPLCMLFLIRTVRERGWRNVWLCVLSLVLTGLSRWQLLVFAALLMGLYLIFSLLYERQRWSRWTVLALGTIVLAALLCVLPLLLPLLRGLLHQDTAQEVLVEEEWAQTDLLAYVVPNRFHPLIGPSVAPLYARFRKNRGHIAFLGYTTLLLACHGATRARKAALYWGSAAICIIALALGPVLRFNGHLYPSIPMPYRLIGWLTPLRALRTTDRFNVVLGLPLAVLAGYAITHLESVLKHRLCSRLARWVVPATGLALAVLILFEYVSIPFANVKPHDLPFYRRLATEPGDFAILEVPMGRGYSKAYMFLQTIHGKRLVDGHVSRTPAQAYAYIRAHPFLSRLSLEGDFDTERCDVSRQLASLADSNIRYIVIHKVDVPGERLARWRDYLTVSPVYEDQQILAYATAPAPEHSLRPDTVLGDGMALIRATVTPTCTTPGGSLWVDLRWTTVHTPSMDYTRRLGLFSADGEEVQVQSAVPCPGWPTSHWGVNAVTIDRGMLQISPLLPPGTYTLRLSLLAGAGSQPITPPQSIATVAVAAPSDY